MGIKLGEGGMRLAVMGNLGLHKLQCQRFYKKLHVTVFVHTIDMFILYHVVYGSLRLF